MVSKLYLEVQPEDFMKIGGEKPSHLLIEQTLISLGKEAGGNGNLFKKEILKLAGWNGGPLTTYASRAKKAAEAFNRIRAMLDGIKSADELKKKFTAAR